MARRLLCAVALLLLVPLAPAAQTPGAPTTLRLDSIPPLPPTIRLYGADLPTGAPAPAWTVPDPLALSLDDAVALALARNPGVRTAALEALRAETDVTRGNAGYGIDLDGSVSTGANASALLGGAARTTTSTDAGVSLSTLVYDGGGREAALRRLRADAMSTALAADADAEALALAVAVSWLDVARQTALVAALAEAVGVSEDRLRLAVAEVQIGTAAEIDAALALSDLNADLAALLRQRVALAAARATLGGLLALSDPEAVTADAPLALTPAPAYEGLVAGASTANRRVRSLGAARVAAEAVVDEVQSRFRPSVRVGAGAGVGFGGTGVVLPWRTPTLGPTVSYGATLSLPLLDRGERQRQRSVAEIRVLQAEARTADAQAQARADAARLAATARGQRALVALETQNVAIARQNVRVALAQLQFGLITPFDLRQVQLALVATESRLVEAVFQVRASEAQLALLAGALLPTEAALAPATAPGRAP